MTNAIDIDCPNCGKTIRSSSKKCPSCHAELDFSSIDDLEEVAKSFDDEGGKRTQADKETDRSADEEKKGFIGKLFGRGRK